MNKKFAENHHYYEPWIRFSIVENPKFLVHIKLIAFGRFPLFEISFTNVLVYFKVSIHHLSCVVLVLGNHYHVYSFLECFILSKPPSEGMKMSELSKPIFLFMWSDLVIQASSVLQGSSSRLMVLSTFGAMFVTFRVVVDADVQEAHEIVLGVRLLIAFSFDLYCQFICYLTIIFWSIAFLALFLCTFH